MEVGTARSDSAVSEAAGDAVDQVEGIVARNTWIETIGRLGWAAKGAVYALMGVLAVAIARLQPTGEDASPEGAMSMVIERRGGRLLLGVVGVGLALYSAWRLLSAVLERREGVSGWVHRIAYLFSGVFYAVLTVTAVRSALAGADPGRSTTVERLSASLLGSSIGRAAVLLGGIVIIAVAMNFARQAIGLRFREELALDDAGRTERRVIDVLGVAGHLGRAVVTALVGLFVTVAAVQADADEASGFDRALRHVASTSWGPAVVGAAALGLITYGIFCLASLRHRDLVDAVAREGGR